ncbi:unnamed protein product [Musa acuminata subsp. malaccensis]|uniref:(wild Malaysian banana) hypothetical protein n=1 Tax=Musa acuminata subsp. malaccensis TaxID=214687 RepID=A0A804HY82_MUSAM|nr:unnamed protein product [Musa acuminata subsp. malaccensis]
MLPNSFFSTPHSTNCLFSLIRLKHVPFYTGRIRTKLGIVQKRGKAECCQDSIDHPFFLRQRSTHFPRNRSYISFPFPFQSSYVFPHPFVDLGKNPILANSFS